MFILSQTTIIFSDFPVNVRVKPFMVYGYIASTFFQSGIDEISSETLPNIPGFEKCAIWPGTYISDTIYTGMIDKERSFITDYMYEVIEG